MTDDLRQRIALAGGLVNQGDLTRLWNLSRPRVSEICGHPTFPEPVAQVGGRPVWAGAEVQSWRDARTSKRTKA